MPTLAPILPNRLYPIGASSSPETVFVTRVGKGEAFAGRDLIFFRPLDHCSTEQRMEAPVFASLCAKGMETRLGRIEAWGRIERLNSSPLPAHMARDREHFTRWLAGENVMPELSPADYSPEMFTPMCVRVSVANPAAFDKSQGRAGDPYYVAESYGSVLIPNEHPDHYVIHMARRAIPTIQADARFKIEEMRPEFTPVVADLPQTSSKSRPKTA